MAMGTCRECRTEVSDRAKTCPKCGISKPVKRTSLLVKLLAGLFGLAVLGNIIGGVSGGSTSTSSSPSASTTAIESTAGPVPNSVPAPAATPPAVDPAAERTKNKAEMDLIRKRLADNRESLRKYYASRQQIKVANDDHLRATAIALSRGLSKHQEDQRQAAEAKALSFQVAEQIREMYASTMEEAFVKNGIDAKVSAGGKGKARLTITYVLMSQPLVYKFQNEMDVPSNAKKVGFTKVVYSNGLESSLGKSWTVDL
ncbi:MAG: hypothetical protein ROZ64_08090 [Burkholderiaceae bacterium]|nr:hypothetical protein [Burkholderiaceae bacterium]